VAEDGLVVALRKHLDLIGRTHRLGVKLVADEVGDLPADVEADLYRVAQEALTNVVRHAEASAIQVAVARTPVGVTLTVTDDGAGFDPRARAIRAHRLGLTSMAARTARHGGSTRVESVIGQGTLVTAEVPLP
jgi:signal transduction histidine kinase